MCRQGSPIFLHQNLHGKMVVGLWLHCILHGQSRRALDGFLAAPPLRRAGFVFRVCSLLCTLCLEGTTVVDLRSWIYTACDVKADIILSIDQDGGWAIAAMGPAGTVI